MNQPHNADLKLRWTTAADLDLISQTRWLAFGRVSRMLEYYAERLAQDTRCAPTDHILAEREGQAVGTATSLPMTMYIRGAAMSCQGVAYVGTIPTERRRGGDDPTSGVASTIMRAVIEEARRREQVVTALMPFRASFYERFGYGIVERRVEWTVPTSLLPQGPADGWRHATAADAPAQKACRQRAVEIGQCDIVRTEAGWRHIEPTYESAMTFVHPTGNADVIDARLILTTTIRHDRDVLVVEEFSTGSPAAMLSILHFLGKFSDQYHAVQITLPADFPLNRILRQTQLPHRRVAHAFATARPFTRMQVRVLNHRRLIESMLLPPHAPFASTIAIRESEGTITRLRIEYDAGHATVTDGPADAQFTCSDSTWAAIVTGDLPASTAVRLGLATSSDPVAAANLDILAAGPVPFCNEYF